MLKNVTFNATPAPDSAKDRQDMGLDLKLPDSTKFTFLLSGECDIKSLRRITRTVKALIVDKPEKEKKT